MTSDLQELRRRIESRIARVAAEIRAYPAPIPGCDAQFNHLLEQRRLLARELARLDGDVEDGSLSIEKFVGTSACRDTLSELVDDG